MKKLIIETIINEDKIATAIRTKGYDENKISDQMELLGILENTKGIITERIKKLVDIKR